MFGTSWNQQRRLDHQSSLADFPFPWRNIRHDNTFATNTMQGLRESTVARVPLHRSFRVPPHRIVPSSIIDDINPCTLFLPPARGATASHLLTIPVTFSDFFFNNKLVKMIGPMALFLSLYVLYVYTLFRCEEFDADKRPADVQLVGSLPQHFLIACSLTNSIRYRMDRQIVPSRSLR